MTTTLQVLVGGGLVLAALNGLSKTRQVEHRWEEIEAKKTSVPRHSFPMSPSWTNMWSPGNVDLRTQVNFEKNNRKYIGTSGSVSPVGTFMKDHRQ